MNLIGCRPGSANYAFHAVFRNESVPEGGDRAYLMLGLNPSGPPFWAWGRRIESRPYESYYHGSYTNYRMNHGDVSEEGDFASFDEFFQAMADPKAWAVQHVL